MKKTASIFLSLLVIFACQHKQQHISIPEQHKEIYYPEQLPASYYRYQLPKLRLPAITSIIAVGDIMLGDHVIYYLDKFGAHYPFDSTKHLLQFAHFTIGNLEAPFGTKGVKFDKKFNFMVHPRYARGLVDAGFNVLNIANNHIMDFGEQALISTMETLDSIGIRYCGAGTNAANAGKPAILDYCGIKVGFIGCSLTFPEEFWAKKDSAGTFYPRENELIQHIHDSEQQADFTVVSFHWGQELRTTPKPYQQFYAHLAIDAGADLILGHHPHVLQGLEIYNDRLIIYSLGNFAFGSYSNKSKDSIILKTYLTTGGLLYARVIPISVLNNQVAFQPRVLKGKQTEAVLAYLNTISQELNQGTDIIDKDGIIWGKWTFSQSR